MVDPEQVESTFKAQTQVVAAVNPSPRARSKSLYQRILEFIEAHPGCLTREITAHKGRSVRKFLDEMDRGGVIVHVTKHDRYSCADDREKRHYTPDQHLGHIARYGVGGWRAVRGREWPRTLDAPGACRRARRRWQTVCVGSV